MRTVGIIAEYNPFHTGHAYHIRKAKELSGAAYAIVVMSPDFVQRGEPAVFDKFTRTRMALQNGADLVLELPIRYAAGSAEYFALGAVTLLEQLGVTDTLCFGTEDADLSLFQNISNILADEPAEYTEKLRQALKHGKTYPQARAEALVCALSGYGFSASAYRTDSVPAGSDPDSILRVLNSPNNILGIEYCRALQKLKSRILPIPVRREGISYHSTGLDRSYCSAAALRQAISVRAVPESGSALESVLRYIPENCRRLFLDACENIVTSEELLPFLTQKLLALDSFDSIFDISSDLSDRIRNLRFHCIGKTYAEIVALLKSRQLTEAHIRRSLLHLILDIRADDVKNSCSGKGIAYAKVLGLRRDASPLLHRIKKECSVPFLTKPAHASCLMDSFSARMWQQDLFASHLYRSIRSKRAADPFRSEYEISPLII